MLPIVPRVGLYLPGTRMGGVPGDVNPGKFNPEGKMTSDYEGKVKQLRQMRRAMRLKRRAESKGARARVRATLRRMR